MTSKENLIFGKSMEKQLKPFIEIHLDCNLLCLKKYHPFDFKSSNKKIIVELKSRKNSSYKYQSTMIGYNKIIRGQKYMMRRYDVYFYFKFTDGLFYYKMNNKSIDECEIKMYGIKKYFFIPITKLKKID